MKYIYACTILLISILTFSQDGYTEDSLTKEDILANTVNVKESISTELQKGSELAIESFHPVFVHKAIRIHATPIQTKAERNASDDYTEITADRILFKRNSTQVLSNHHQASLFTSNAQNGFLFDFETTNAALRSAGTINITSNTDITVDGIAHPLNGIVLGDDASEDALISVSNKHIILTTPNNDNGGFIIETSGDETMTSIDEFGDNVTIIPGEDRVMFSINNHKGFAMFEGNLNVLGRAKEHGKNLVPRGTIVAYTGPQTPFNSEWVFCDGRIYETPDGPLQTPDLRSRFIYAAPRNEQYTGVSYGGQDTHEHTLESAITAVTSHDHDAMRSHITFDASTDNWGAGSDHAGQAMAAQSFQATFTTHAYDADGVPYYTHANQDANDPSTPYAVFMASGIPHSHMVGNTWHGENTQYLGVDIDIPHEQTTAAAANKNTNGFTEENSNEDYYPAFVELVYMMKT